jgi:hypothetical protein
MWFGALVFLVPHDLGSASADESRVRPRQSSFKVVEKTTFDKRASESVPGSPSAASPDMRR